MPPLLQIDLRLVLQEQLVAFERASQLIFQRDALALERGHERRVRLQIVLAAVLGVVHRRVGVLEQRLDVAGVFRVDRQARARGHREFLLLERERFRQRAEHLVRDRRRLRRDRADPRELP